MADNLVIPQVNPSTGYPYAGYSIGTYATDHGDSISVVRTLDVLSAANNFALIDPIAKNTVSNVVTSFRAYGVGSSLFAGGNTNKNISVGSLVNGQALQVSLSGRSVSYSRYNTTQDGTITINFVRPETWQRSDWGSTQIPYKIGSFTITINGTTSTTVNGNPYAYANTPLTLATGLKAATYSVKIKDNYSGFWMTIPVIVGSTANGSPRYNNTYDAVPKWYRTNGGAWTTNTLYGYA